MSLHRPLVLAAATPMELRAALAPLMDKLPTLPHEGESTTVRAAGRGLTLLVTGVGPLNAAYALGRLLGDGGRFLGVVNVGLAGSYDSQSLPLGAVALAGEEVFPDYGVETPQGLDHQGIGLAQAKGREGGVWERLPLYPLAAAKDMGFSPEALASLEALPLVPCLTSGRVSGSPEQAQRLRARYAVGLENMEGFALALGCLRAQLPFLELRSVSNPCGARDSEQWDKRLALTNLGKACAALFG